MIKQWLITGDCHGDFSRFKNLNKEIQKDNTVAIIILGDVGLNYFGDERDSHLKNMLDKQYNFHLYCLKGNHEMRPSDVPNMELVYDDNVHGYVWMQKHWPKIKYFKDYGIYHILGYRIAVFGGAYSVDKYYRLKTGLKWFSNELMSPEELYDCEIYFNTNPNSEFDFVLSHTCPLSWEPKDLFLSMIDQSTVNKSMENFLEKMKNSLKWKIWLWAHFHADRIEYPGAEMFYKDMEDIQDIAKRWATYQETKELPWYLEKGPNFKS